VEGSESGRLRATRLTVRGRVQGVGFRYFVVREAEALGLSGWVRNRSGGEVEILAQGTPRALDRLEKALRQGPRFAVVQSVHREEAVAFEGPEGFGIRY
jgi:acylphosphatase